MLTNDVPCRHELKQDGHLTATIKSKQDKITSQVGICPNKICNKAQTPEIQAGQL
jgi:hypothetical protein